MISGGFTVGLQELNARSRRKDLASFSLNMEAEQSLRRLAFFGYLFLWCTKMEGKPGLK